MTDELRNRLQAMNPEPVGDPSPDELATVFAVIEARRSTMAVDEAPNTTDTAAARGGWLRPAAAFAGMAMLMVLVVGAAALLFGGGDAPTVGTARTTTVPPTTEAAPAIAEAAQSPEVLWQRVGTDVMDPVFGLLDMTSASMGLVAVGYNPGSDNRQDGVIFTSEDGATWSRVAEDDPALIEGQVLIYGVTEGGPGFVAVGLGNEPDESPASVYPTVWTSIDGTSWTRVAKDPDVFTESGAMLDVIAVDTGLVAAGNIDELGDDGTVGARPAAWFSPDGVAWSRVFEGDWIDTVGGSLPGFTALERAPSGVVVGAGGAENSLGEAVAAVWASLDGESWERVDPDADVFGPGTGIVDVAWGSAGFVAVGTVDDTETALWRSSDGYSWSRIEIAGQPFDEAGVGWSVEPLEAGYVAFGPPHWAEDHQDGNVTLWTSPDGSIWSRAHTIGQGFAEAVVVTETGIAVAGASFDVGDFHAAVWTGPNLDPSNPPSSDTSEALSTVAETTTPVPELAPAGLVTVERITDESLDEYGERIWAMAVGGPGIVAVGEVMTPDDMDAVVVVSTDGRNWDRVDDPAVFGGEGWDELHAIWSSSTGLIAQGRDAEASYPDVVWYASIDGIDWVLITDEDLYNAWEPEWRSGFDPGFEFYEGGPGWVAALYRNSPEPIEVFVSADGIDWETTTEPLGNLVDSRPPVPQNPGSAGFDSGNIYFPWNMAWDEDQVVAVRYHADPNVGVSRDGGDTWLQVDPEAFGDDHLLTTIDVVQFGDSYIIAGNSVAKAEVWILEWSEQEDS